MSPQRFLAAGFPTVGQLRPFISRPAVYLGALWICWGIFQGKKPWIPENSGFGYRKNCSATPHEVEDGWQNDLNLLVGLGISEYK